MLEERATRMSGGRPLNSQGSDRVWKHIPRNKGLELSTKLISFCYLYILVLEEMGTSTAST